MLDVGFIHVIRDCLGTAEGVCLKCGAYFSITIPSDHPAVMELSEMFEEHFAEKHPDLLEVRSV